MWLSLFFILLSGCIALYEIPKFKKNKQKREIKVFLGFLLAATVLTILKVQEVPIPNPLRGIMVIYEPIGTFILNLLTP